MRRCTGPRRRSTPRLCAVVSSAAPRDARLVPVARLDEAREQRMRLQRLRLELRMELHRQVPRVAGQLRDLDELAVGRLPEITQAAAR